MHIFILFQPVQQFKNEFLLEILQKLKKKNYIYILMNLQNLLGYHIYPTPPLGQDMTQAQFLIGV